MSEQRSRSTLKLQDSMSTKTNEHKLSRNTFSLVVERLFVTIKMSLKTKTKLILRKILIG